MGMVIQNYSLLDLILNRTTLKYRCSSQMMETVRQLNTCKKNLHYF